MCTLWNLGYLEVFQKEGMLFHQPLGVAPNYFEVGVINSQYLWVIGVFPAPLREGVAQISEECMVSSLVEDAFRVFFMLRTFGTRQSSVATGGYNRIGSKWYPWRVWGPSTAMSQCGAMSGFSHFLYCCIVAVDVLKHLNNKGFKIAIHSLSKVVSRPYKYIQFLFALPPF